MDLAHTTGSPYILGDYTFPALNMADLGKLTEQMRAESRASLIKRLDECEIKGKDRFAQLTALDDRYLSLEHGQLWTRGAEGCKATLAASLAKLPDSPGVNELDISPFDQRKIALWLWGERYEELDASEGPGDDDPLD